MLAKVQISTGVWIEICGYIKKDQEKISTLLIQVIEAAKTLPEEQSREVSSFIKFPKNKKGYKNLSRPQ